MLRGLPFYGTGAATGGAATFFDPIIGATVTKIPQSGSSRKVTMRGVTLVSDIGGDHEEFAVLTIGQDGQGDAHKITVRPVADGDSPAPFAMGMSFTPLGDFEVSENEDLSCLLYDPGAAALMSGVLWFEDGEPELVLPKGRIVTFRGPTTADYTITYSATGGGAFANLPNPQCVYYVCGAEVVPQDALVQALAVHASGKGHAAVLPPKGRIWFPGCPLEFDGLETVVLKGQVQAVTEVGVTVYAIEVPKQGELVGQTGVREVAPFTGFPLQTSKPATVKFTGKTTMDSILGAVKRA